MAIIDDYKRAKGNVRVIRGNYAKSFFPNPIIEDFKRGFITRYFAKQRNNLRANIVEIDRLQFNSHSEGGGINIEFYNVISLRWRIIGTLQEIQSVNFLSVENAELSMRNITQRLGNLVQFAKFSD